MDGDGVVSLTTHDLSSLLSTADRDFLIRNTGDQVKVEILKGKKVGLYFSASWCGPCHRFTPNLVEVYNDLSSERGDFEVVFISADRDDESFNGYFSKMPWLAIPFSDSETRDKLDELMEVSGIPHLVIVDEQGKVLTDVGVEIIQEYGVEGYPFSRERIKELKDKEEEARKNQTLRSLLLSNSRDFVISSDGKNVPISELEGTTVALYFALSSHKACVDFTPSLVDLYEKVKAKGERFTVVSIPLDDDEESFQKGLEGMPWYTLPVKDKSCEKLARYFELSTVPTVVIIGPDGKTLHQNVVETIEDFGVQGYPFTPEKFKELAELQKAKKEAQTLDSVLVSGDLDFVIDKNGAKIPVSDLVGKTILIYFSAHWCPPCRAFLPKLIETYNKIKEEKGAIEVIFISSDRDQASFNEFFATMPWLALPFGDSRKASLSRLFKVQGIPTLVALGPTGKTVTKEARELIRVHGAEAYPFTDERLKEIEARFEELAKEWPQKLKHALHEEHELKLMRRTSYICDGCEEEGHVWAFYCYECDFDLHPKCALEDDKGKESKGNENEGPKEGWVCDGDVCVKAS